MNNNRVSSRSFAVVVVVASPKHARAALADAFPLSHTHPASDPHKSTWRGKYTHRDTAGHVCWLVESGRKRGEGREGKGGRRGGWSLALEG